MRLPHFYWNTRFVNSQNKKHFWSSGSAVVLVLTTRCPFRCSYCPMYIPNGEQPKYDECSLDEWKKYISEYPEWIEEFFISGGETSLHPQVSEFVNWLVERGHHVCIFSNLWKPESFLTLKKSYRLVLYPTFHASDNKERFDRAYNMLKDIVRVIPIELKEMPVLPYAKSKDTYQLDYFVNEMRLHFAPDTPRTKRTYTASLPLYKDGTCLKQY
jgi:organic radical activating enzyme